MTDPGGRGVKIQLPIRRQDSGAVDTTGSRNGHQLVPKTSPRTPFGGADGLSWAERDPKLEAHYLYGDVSAYFVQGNQNSVRYVNC